MFIAGFWFQHYKCSLSIMSEWRGYCLQVPQIGRSVLCRCKIVPKKSNSTVCGVRWAIVAKSCLRWEVLQRQVLILLYQHKPSAPLTSVGPISLLTEGEDFSPNCSWFSDGEVIAPPHVGRLLWASSPWQPARLAAEQGFPARCRFQIFRSLLSE